MALQANSMFLYSWKAKHMSQAENPAHVQYETLTEHDHPERLLTSIGSSQTLPKLDLACLNN